jgi:hypothetical protein
LAGTSAILTEAFCFPQSLQGNARILPQLDMAISFQIHPNSSFILPTDNTGSRYSHHHKIKINKMKIVTSEVLTVVVMNSNIFWDIMLCSLLNVNRCFGGTYRLHLQGRRIGRARNQCESRQQAEPAGFSLSLFSNTADGGGMFL